MPSTPFLGIPYPATGEQPYDLHTTLIDFDSYVYNRVNLSPGAPQSGYLNLSGAGTFGGNLTVGGTAGIASNATVGGTLVVTGALTAPNVAYVNQANVFTANQTMNSGNTLASSDYNATTVYGYRLGSDFCDFGHVRIRGILIGGVLGSSFVTATSGAQVVAKAASAIAQNSTIATPGSITSGVTTVNATVDTSATGTALFAVNDAVRIRAVVSGALKAVEAIVTTANAPVGNLQTLVLTLYTGTSTSTTFLSGTAVVNYGPSGSSYITLSADGAFGGATANVSLWGHSGQPWTDAVRTVAIPADGQVRVGSNVAAAATTSFATFPSAVTYNSESMLAGMVMLGDNTSGKANVLWKPSTGQLLFRGGTATQAYVDTTGAITAAAGKVTLDTSGITLRSDNSSLLSWKSAGGTAHGGMSVNHDVTGITSTSFPISSINATSGGLATISMQVKPVTDNLTFGLLATDSGDAYGYLSYSGVGTFKGLFVGAALAPTARLQVRSAAEQLRLDYDASNYANITVASSGATTIATVGSTMANADLVLAPGGGDTSVTGTLSVSTFLSSGNPKVSAYLANNQSTTTGTWTAVAWDAEHFDTHTMHDNVTNNTRITIPTGGGGRYVFHAAVMFASNASGIRAIRFLKNGSTSIGYGQVNLPPCSGVSTSVMTTYTFDTLAAGDYIEVQCYQSSGGNLNALKHSEFGGTDYFTYVQAYLLP